MSGFLIYITMVVSLASWGGYKYPLPDVYQVGQPITITADAACPYRVIEADIPLTNNQIPPWENSISFTEAGYVDELRISCPCPFVDGVATPDVIPVGWSIK